MRGFAEREIFTSREIRFLRQATLLVDKAPYETAGALVRCHELARAVGQVLGLPVCDGRFGFVEHSWLWIPHEGESFDGFNPGEKWQLPAILDVYVPGALPQVQLIDAQSGGLPARYVYERQRTDIDDKIVQKLIEHFELVQHFDKAL